jgi:hypothetical protein
VRSWFGTAELTDDEPVLAAGEGVDVPWALATGAARTSLRASVDEFVLRLTRRRDRDVVRIRDYYEEIDREIRHKLTRARTSEETRRRELDRLDATATSYRARLAEVAERARVRVRLVPIAVFACRMPTWQITVRLKRKSWGPWATAFQSPLHTAPGAFLPQRACPLLVQWLSRQLELHRHQGLRTCP